MTRTIQSRIFIFRIVGVVAVLGRRRHAFIVFCRIRRKKKPDIVRYPACLKMCYQLFVVPVGTVKIPWPAGGELSLFVCSRAAAAAVSAAYSASSTRSRNSLPALKCGTYFFGTKTFSPVLGFRPVRGGRKFSPKLPNPLISTRSPCDNVDDIASNIVFTASSASLGASWLWRDAKISINSDFVMDFKR